MAQIEIPDELHEAVLLWTGCNDLTLALMYMLGAEPRECASDTCANVFYFQRNGTVKRHHRRDAIYCSNGCARNQAQREYRRRLKTPTAT